jgi:very-short-patch-repair endonuclease
MKKIKRLFQRDSDRSFYLWRYGDRRKDQLLQQNGYFVLRFLAEDVGKNLDIVLDTIHRTLFCRQK